MCDGKCDKGRQRKMGSNCVTLHGMTRDMHMEEGYGGGGGGSGVSLCVSGGGGWGRVQVLV